ncbi:hypothetical protein jhhlp_004689 [Lomentospora prolificans]|uniref:Uncharacterized protein n=1 Tax=Lomentospora prolificans TaxID=41688 RepID=A0A2N3NC87_9PEZI|nr:hypothetical protein jhhlp_004689 [Lomentospora prolificans]
MTGQSPSPSVKIPTGAANYTQATIDPELRSTINGLLLQEGHVRRIQDRLIHTLNAHQANWPTNIQNHALQLLRSGEVTSFPALLRRVLEDVRQDTQLGKSGETSTNGADSKANGDANKKAVNGADQMPNLAVPQAVVDEALQITRECLEEIAYLE